jgi:hypothetical protein
MGFKYFSSGDTPAPGNPNPERFEVIKRRTWIPFYAALHLRYGGCTNYEGEKILVIDYSKRGIPKEIDPHFNEDGIVVARFQPTAEGWQDAVDFCDNKCRRKTS